MSAIVINRLVSLTDEGAPLAEANRALLELKRGVVRGAKVLVVD